MINSNNLLVFAISKLYYELQIVTKLAQLIVLTNYHYRWTN